MSSLSMLTIVTIPLLKVDVLQMKNTISKFYFYKFYRDKNIYVTHQ